MVTTSHSKGNGGGNSTITTTTTTAATPKQYSSEDYLNKATEFMHQLSYDLALQFCQRALDVSTGSNAKAHESMATILLEGFGQTEDAFDNLKRAIEIAPMTGHEKYMLMAQLVGGKESVECYSKGIEVLNDLKQRLLNGVSSSSVDELSIQDIAKELAQAYCAIAEVYMTDLCYQNNAQNLCHQNLELAVLSCPNHIESLQQYASFYISLSDNVKANELITRSIGLWLIDGSGGDNTVPEYNSRLTTARLLIELERHQDAQKVLDGLLNEDDEVVESWYLYGWLSHLCENHEMAVIALSKAQNLVGLAIKDDDVMGAENDVMDDGEEEQDENVKQMITRLLDSYTQQGLTLDKAHEILEGSK